MTMNTDPSRTRKLLRWVAIAAALDFLLLIPLLYASFTDNHDLISVLGPIHGIGYLIQLFLTVVGAGEKRWGWWFPALVFVTGGPLGTIAGDLVLRKRLP